VPDLVEGWIARTPCQPFYRSMPRHTKQGVAGHRIQSDRGAGRARRQSEGACHHIIIIILIIILIITIIACTPMGRVDGGGDI
jgi:hypothetical protein